MCLALISSKSIFNFLMLLLINLVYNLWFLLRIMSVVLHLFKKLDKLLYKRISKEICIYILTNQTLINTTIHQWYCNLFMNIVFITHKTKLIIYYIQLIVLIHNTEILHYVFSVMRDRAKGTSKVRNKTELLFTAFEFAVVNGKLSAIKMHQNLVISV